MFPTLVEHEIMHTRRISRRAIAGVYWHQTVRDRLQITRSLKMLVPKNRHFFDTKMVFNNFPEIFETSNLAQSNRLEGVPIQIRCLF